MGKRAQVIVVSLWILVILTILAVGIGHRVSMALRLSSYQRNKLKATYLAKAGINRAIVEIKNDKTPGYDSLNDNWADNEEIFEKIMFDENQTEFATVSYIVEEEGKKETKFGVVDEERKININIASEELFTALLEEYEISPAQDIAKNLRIWRGDIEDQDKIYENLGYTCKSAKFTNIAELKLVKDMTSEGYEKIKYLITVDGSGAVDINTVSLKVLTIFTRGIARGFDPPLEDTYADSVTAKIIELRNSKGFFQTKGEIGIELTGSEETNIFNELMKDTNTTLQSNNFLIESIGNVGRIKSKVTAVCDRNGKILYWHEG